MENKKMSLDFVKYVIEGLCKRYFKCGDVVDVIIAYREGVTVKVVKNYAYSWDGYDPYDVKRRNLLSKVGYALHRLKDEGYVRKYSVHFWMVV